MRQRGNLFTALAVPGMKIARAWLGLCNGTGELLGATRIPVDWNGKPPGDRQYVACSASSRRSYRRGSSWVPGSSTSWVEANFGMFSARANGGGVAFFAHVGGFLFGLTVTLRLYRGRRAGASAGQAVPGDAPA
jgi:hypothetical protein